MRRPPARRRGSPRSACRGQSQTGGSPSSASRPWRPSGREPWRGLEETNGFSKKVENHARSVARFMTYYNVARIHKRPRVTPAMAVGVSERLGEGSDMVASLEAAEPKAGKRGPYQ